MNPVPRWNHAAKTAVRLRSAPMIHGLLAVGLVTLGIATAAPAAAGTIPASSAPLAAPTCAWPDKVSADSKNVFLPDSAATYWVLPFDVSRDLEITLAGVYPDARYMSINVYNGGRGSFESNGVSSGLADHQIAPDAGSENPWRQTSAPGGRFTVTVRMAVAPGQTNVLPLAPADAADGSRGSLIYRVYLPANGDASTVELPTVTLRQNGAAEVLPPCPGSADDRTEASAAVVDGPADPGGRPAPPPATFTSVPLSFARTTQTNSVFPNPDNAYLSGWVNPPRAGEVIVIRAKAPRATAGPHPAPWPAPQDQVRYWSMCTNLEHPLLPVVVNRLPGGAVDYGCRHDALTKVDASGFYTYVIGTERQRATIERVPGVTFLPFSIERPAAPHLVLLRNMIPVADFAYAVQRVPQDDDPASAAAVMGPYYPRASTCALTTLVASGSAGCAPTASGEATDG